MNVVVLLLLMLVGSGHQDANLYRMREAWVRAQTQQEKDSIRKEVLDAIPDRRVNAEYGQEQVQLWDLCCSLWDVQELFGEAGKVQKKDLPKFSVLKIDGVTFYETASTMSPNKDTAVLASNRLPGYGGIDIQFSTEKYFPNLGRKKWLAPSNIGRDINTGADEFGAKYEDSTLTFLREVDGVVRKFRATPRSVVHDIEVNRTCAMSGYVIVNVRDCRDNMISSIAFEDSVVMDMPPNAKTLEFRCRGTSRPRVFVRCDVTTRTLTLRDTDIRTTLCLHDGITTQHNGITEFGFSIYEDAASSEAAFRDVMDEVSRYLDKQHNIVIDQVPGHLDPLFLELRHLLDSHEVNYSVEHSGALRSSIRIE